MENSNFNLDELGLDLSSLSAGNASTNVRTSRTAGQSVLEVLTSEGGFRLSKLACIALKVKAGDKVEFVPFYNTKGSLVGYGLEKGKEKTEKGVDEEGNPITKTYVSGALLAEAGEDCTFSSRNMWHNLGNYKTGQKPEVVKLFTAYPPQVISGVLASFLKESGTREKISRKSNDNTSVPNVTSNETIEPSNTDFDFNE